MSKTTKEEIAAWEAMREHYDQTTAMNEEFNAARRITIAMESELLQTRLDREKELTRLDAETNAEHLARERLLNGTSWWRPEADPFKLEVLRNGWQAGLAMYLKSLENALKETK